MKHKITYGEGQTLILTVASASEGDEKKDLRMVMSDGEIKWVVRHFKEGRLTHASKLVTDLATAVAVYNLL